MGILLVMPTDQRYQALARRPGLGGDLFSCENQSRVVDDGGIHSVV